MLRAQIIPQPQLASPSYKILLHKPFLHSSITLPTQQQSISARRTRKNGRFGATKSIRAVVTDKTTSVKAVVTAQATISGLISDLPVKGLDDIQDVLGKSLLLELVSSDLDPKTGKELPRIKGYAHQTTKDKNEAKYESDLVIPASFKVGAVIVENEHHREMFLKDIILEGSSNGIVNISCNSWVASKFDTPNKRVFFANKSYLPTETPDGLTKLRKEELIKLRGDGRGERKTIDRIYDYDVYNDIGEPDTKPELKRPVLGGAANPYPRRCRTGRPPCKTDPASESRNATTFYVPRDEAFSEVKELTFGAKTVYSVLHAVLPALESAVEKETAFAYLADIDALFKEGVQLPKLGQKNFWSTLLPRLLNTIADGAESLLRFEPPMPLTRDNLFWFRDEEFGRQTLAGLNPYSIQCITEWPLKSSLDPKIYGPALSSITTEIIQKEIGGMVTVAEAIKQKKLFVLDYHDLLMPYVEKVRALDGHTLYGSRTVFFLTEDGTLRPLAIELSRPPMEDKPYWNWVYTPAWHATGVWLWRMAKAHVLAHDAGYHQLVSHWLRTHCCTEPYIIAANRQLSAMHPIYKLLHPHFRYTMEINALAREALINAGGIIETTFAPGKYSTELSSVAYDKLWQFDLQALPADLISRGMAVEDPSAPHGVKLAIEDYPFANDGLLLWDIIKDWVSDYVNFYYPNPNQVISDEELQAWWTEIRTVGHGDKKDSTGWPDLKTNQDLIQIVTTMVWVTSGHHAAVNFGQYAYGGYFPNRPTIARTKMPNEDGSGESLKNFLNRPEEELLKCFPSQLQATKVMAILDVLSSHSVDEEYLGEYMEPAWAEDAHIKGAFDKFNGRLRELQKTIDERNNDLGLKNRTGAGVTPYELLKPFSEPGVTGKGVPYSISI